MYLQSHRAVDFSNFGLQNKIYIHWLALNVHLFVETQSTVIPLWSGCHVQAQCLRSDVVAAPGQTTLLCFALQAVCGCIKQGPCMKEQVEEGGGRQASEWEQPENRRWLLTFTWMPSVGKSIGRGTKQGKRRAIPRLEQEMVGSVWLWLLRLQHAAPVEREGLGGRSDGWGAAS